jgi:hypothetical protein
MTEMLDRVAWALRQTQATLSNPEADALARAAIEAMREPTEMMVNEGAAELRAGDLTRSTPPHVWRAMIDEALSSTPTDG